MAQAVSAACPRKGSALCILTTREAKKTFGSARDLKESPAQIPHGSVFYARQFNSLDSVAGFSYYLDIFMHPIALTVTKETEVLMPNGITRWQSV
jgi:hypothetical protein